MSRITKVVIVVLFLLLQVFSGYGVASWYVAHAQDAPTVCREPEALNQFVFHIPATWNDPDLPSWTALGDGYAMDNETTIRIDALTQVEIYGEGFPQWEQDLRVGQALVFSYDYTMIVIGDDQTPLCDAFGYPPPMDTSSIAQNRLNANVVGICPMYAIDATHGGMVCLWGLPEATNAQP